MRRTTEISFVIVGIAIFGLLFVGSSMVLFDIFNGSDINNLAQEFINDENITEVTASQIVDFITYAIIYMLVVFMVCILLGSIAISFLKANKKPKAASKILILTAVLGTVFTLLIGIFGAIPYLIAGIVCTSRKETVSQE